MCYSKYQNTIQFKSRGDKPHLETALQYNINQTTHWVTSFISSCFFNLLGGSLSGKAVPDTYGTAEGFCQPVLVDLLFHVTTTSVFSPFYICPFCTLVEFWGLSRPVSLHLVTKPQPCHSLVCQMCCIRFSFVGFLRNKENTKIFCVSRNINFLSQGALDMGFGLFVSKWKQSLNLSRILEQEEGAQKCLKVLKGDHFSTKFQLTARVRPELLPAVSSSCHSNNITDERLLALAWGRSRFPPSNT